MTISFLCGIFSKLHVLAQSDFRVLGRGRHQVVQDYPVSYSGIEEVVAVQVHRDASTKFYSWKHGLSDDVVEGLPSLVQPDDSLRRWRHFGPIVL